MYMSSEVKERLKRMSVAEHGPFEVRITDLGYWGVFDSLGREYITQVFDDKINLSKENASYICEALNLYQSFKLLDGHNEKVHQSL